MKAAILCPGPSLNLFRGHGQHYGLIVGVNRAALAFCCDIWVASDYPLILRHAAEVMGDPVLVTRDAVRAHMAANPGPWEGAVADYSSIRPAPANDWQRFSATAALVYAAAAGAVSVDGYGMDWAGKQDYDGQEAGADRSELRWYREQDLWLETAHLLQVTVKRVLPVKSEHA